MTALLVTGASGLLGSTVAARAGPTYDVVGTYYQNRVSIDGVDMRRVDLTEPEETRSLEDCDPDTIVHCAGLADVDRCEQNPEVARRLNVTVAEHVATLADRVGARLIHISTDAVFDGRDGRYSEEDAPNPINVYGETKLTAEERVQSIHDDSVVVRTNFYGWNVTDASSLAEWMLSTLRNGEELTGFEDSYFSPIYTEDLAECLLDLSGKSVTGSLHVAGSDRLSKLAFAHELADVFEFDDSLITPITCSDLDLTAPRGTDLSLDTSRAASVLSDSLPGVGSGLARMKEDRTDGR